VRPASNPPSSVTVLPESCHVSRAMGDAVPSRPSRTVSVLEEAAGLIGV
jgi:hypothetical protein